MAVSALPGGSRQQLVMVMPEHELFAAGREVAERAAWIPLLILLLMLPLGWLLSRLLSQPLRQLVAASGRIQSLDFSDSSLPPSPVRELNELMAASEAMKVTIRDFIGLSRDMVAENALEQLLGTVLQSTMHALPAQRGGLWLMDGAQLAPSISRDEHEQPLQLGKLPLDDALLLDTLAASAPQQIAANPALIPVEMRSLLGEDTRQLILLPLRLESQELLGLLVLASSESIAHTQSGHRIHYLQALVGFAAIAIDNRRLASALQQLMNALVELIAGAIDAKSPYTGGHCQRVPELAQALAEAAHQSQQGPFAGFRLSAADREALYIASWLHDCGKVTTPEYVVDKATKLETLYDRIHEIRMRFELLKRDADVAYWQGLAAGEDAALLKEQCERQKAQLDDDFAFVARCNLGGEFMDDADLARLQQIAARRWTRTLDDRLGLGPMERARLAGIAVPSLPVEENLLADKPEHRIARSGADTLPADNRWGFKVKVPELRYHKGELTNLSVRRGTLTEEERYKINAHITETIKMLHALPFPAHLAHVPEIAGGHHERIDGKGYPRGLRGEDMSVLARVMAIADVFEALTAADRPYKPAKPLSEALQIMRKMAEDGHLDPELYQLFLDSGIWRHYAGRYLAAAQADVADSHAYRPRQSLHQH
ncbi:HD domain-containing phosphohydrolase [Vogesella indigofera]|uniref:HD domain-containing phosphohydrolase n=1 Tax=Vogesella indigofera TaxID=45465 RepID=UPI00234F8161|nr:HD domain-containing phosphohydrolase [Vogesella indigofera]MDC7700956.1 HD domain-containing protein [Vogesella indigofera]